ncbi:conserved hypothetical protein [Histoplasma capsulatum G186AR]|uniref:Ribosome biogenesis protein SLX9 n=1 Tax=Ajellomyces capsulatus (strain G186AR / H82 / ATCC MYA-2454 / RMSCC 2432) TaxID=447093 RepID=C0NQD1_AJECG|nr:uncharacterized protein HCBG_05719 [Histoplasma capsulatum G186AR]EEH06403.1 conserved hypothetical protein [Histoplasma capsulatum G186AR]
MDNSSQNPPLGIWAKISTRVPESLNLKLVLMARPFGGRTFLDVLGFSTVPEPSFARDPTDAAPVAPKKRTTSRAKIVRKPAAIPIPSSSPFSDTSTFRTNKKDKRQIKHSVFISRIEKPRTKTLKRRRPSKKLVANLDSLIDALPDAGDENNNPNHSDGHREMIAGQVNIIRQKSLKHKPGAMKRKEMLDRRERERFARNLAQMAVVAPSPPIDAEFSNHTQPHPRPQPGAESVPTSNRWAALRSFITQTIDQNPEFNKAARPT